MTIQEQTEVPGWFGATAQGISFFPAMMSVYMLIYSGWWPFAWGWAGAAAFAVVATLAGMFVVRGVRQIRHAQRFSSTASPDGERIARAMGILNSVTHPIWMIGAIVLLIIGEGRWVMPLLTFVIGAHFLPMARILGRWIDYPLGLLMIAFAVVGAFLASDPAEPWLTVFAVSGIGGTIATASYAAYMARAYGRLTREAGLTFSEPAR